MSVSQAERVASDFSVVTQFSDDPSSFSATVFKDVSGNLTLAFRGSLEFPDFAPTDFPQIGIHGAAYDQIVEMYNWWQRVSAAPGAMVDQVRITPYPTGGTPPQGAIPLYSVLSGEGTFDTYYLESAPQVMATGELTDDITADVDGKVDVTGHSLGAHLALAFNGLFGNDVATVTGFNTPGFLNTAVNQDFFERLGGQVPTAANSQNVTNVFADEARVGDVPDDFVAGRHVMALRTVPKRHSLLEQLAA
jgi:hypothetical protein